MLQQLCVLRTIGRGLAFAHGRGSRAFSNFADGEADDQEAEEVQDNGDDRGEDCKAAERRFAAVVRFGHGAYHMGAR